MKRIGPKMQRVVEFVADHPGLPMIRAAEYAAPHRHSAKPGLMYGYQTCNRALRAGLIREEQDPKHKGWRLLYPINPTNGTKD